MGNELRYFYLLETRRLLLLIGVVFGLFLFVQYLGTATSDMTRFRSSNSTDLNNADRVSNSTKASEGISVNATNGIDKFDIGNSRNLNDTSNDEIDPEDEPPLEDFVGMDHNSNIESGIASNSSVVLNHDAIGDVVPISVRNEDIIPDQETPSVAKFPENPEINAIISTETSPILPIEEDAENILQKNERPTDLKVRDSAPTGGPSISSLKDLKGPEPEVVTISKMNDMLVQSRVSYKKEVCIRIVI